MLIRMGILCCPLWDEEAAMAVRRRLLQVIASLQVVQEKSAPHQQRLLEEILRIWCDEDELDLVITIGGTRPAPGPCPLERVPEATQAVVERLLPGLAEEMRACACERSTLALLDRSIAGIRGRTLLLNLPAGASAAALYLTAVVELIPAILLHLRAGAEAPDLDAELSAARDQKQADDGQSSSPNASVANDEPNQLDFAEFSAFLKRDDQDDQEH